MTGNGVFTHSGLIKNLAKKILTGMSIAVAFSSVWAQATKTEPGEDVIQKVFTLHLGATRVIYNPDLSGETLTVINDQNYPMLVQSDVLAEDQKTLAPFVVTPPLFRLDGLQSSRLRIVRTGGKFPSDRESLQWICVKGIPPKEDSRWADGQSKTSLLAQLSVSSCIKLFVRPSVVKGRPEDLAGNVKWQKVGDKLKGINPTPFYINFSELKVGEKNVGEHHYIEPFSSYEYPFPPVKDTKVKWRVVTDYGGKSRLFEVELK
ncbi:fimbria/pilus periplasmic chaperone [Escherichia coli]